MLTSDRNTIRAFMLFEAATFALAALIHAGYLVEGYAHHEAHLAEAIIATVLLIAILVATLRPSTTRAAGLVGQGFALFATCVGIFTIAVGVGPRTVPDVAYHVAIVIVLLWGLVVTRRASRLGSIQT
ncbi:MAG TPA: hypothetical protein VFH11_01090 [Gemmatimonadota bacterium]|nr:hypothetical protein [Gemmatimonadota bacterium]